MRDASMSCTMNNDHKETKTVKSHALELRTFTSLLFIKSYFHVSSPYALHDDTPVQCPGCSIARKAFLSSSQNN